MAVIVCYVLQSQPPDSCSPSLHIIDCLNREVVGVTTKSRYTPQIALLAQVVGLKLKDCFLCCFRIFAELFDEQLPTSASQLWKHCLLWWLWSIFCGLSGSFLWYWTSYMLYQHMSFGLCCWNLFSTFSQTGITLPKGYSIVDYFTAFHSGFGDYDLLVSVSFKFHFFNNVSNLWILMHPTLPSGCCANGECWYWHL